jgi:hypothetical protein
MTRRELPRPLPGHVVTGESMQTASANREKRRRSTLGAGNWR